MIKYYNRRTKDYEVEKVAGEGYLNWTYSSPVGMSFLEALIKKKLFSKIYGWNCDRKGSRKKINKFISDFDIDMNLCKSDADSFACFNDFFIRQLKPEARPMDMSEDILVSPGDGRLQVFENIDLEKLVQVKGITYSLKELIGNNEAAQKYDKGICMILRLCPTDYHRFHFLDSGICDDTIKIKGDYYSVNPVALAKVPELFCKNKREWSIFHSDNFGDVLYVEVGATCVGTIVQTYKSGKEVKKGDEKGYFKFGGSTVILFLEKDKVSIDKDILEQTRLGYETKILMGESIGHKINKI